MATILEGGQKYEEAYVIEWAGALYGPFESKSDAVDFAMPQFDLPWTLRAVLVRAD